MAIPMYGNPMMTEEEKKRMMAMALSGRDAARMRSPTGMVMANAEQEYLDRKNFEGPSADYTSGPIRIPDGMNIDPNTVNDLTATGVIGSGLMTENEANMLRNNVSPMGTPMTPEQIDEEINRLQMLKNQMMMGN